MLEVDGLTLAVVAALLWAASAPVIRLSLARTRDFDNPRQGILTGLVYGLGSAAIVLTLISGFPQVDAITNPQVALAGVLTFVLGTGIYYFASVAYSENASVAAQYANVKPIITIIAGVVLFQESFTSAKWLAFGLILLGVFAVVGSAIRDRARLLGGLLGLLLAGSWALGEVFVRLSANNFDPLTITQSGLLISAALVVFVAIARKLLFGNSVKAMLPLRTAVPFAFHGVMSFSLAYLCFFAAISKQGLSDTALVTVFWPTLAFLLQSALEPGTFRSTPRVMFIAMTLFTIGSILHIIDRVRPDLLVWLPGGL